MQKGGFVYMLTTASNTAIYTGVSSELIKRVWQHKTMHDPNSFTAKYNVSKLVYYQFYERIELAIAEEKRIKAGSRKQKLELINSMNPDWIDLYPGLLE
jgi:putative endonuclease